MIEHFAQLTGCSDGDIATLIGIPRSTVQAYRTHRRPESLTGEQTDILVTSARAYRDEVVNKVAEMELFS